MGYDNHSRGGMTELRVRKTRFENRGYTSSWLSDPAQCSCSFLIVDNILPSSPRTFSGLTPLTLTLCEIPQLFPEKLSAVWTRKLTWTRASCQEPLSACRGSKISLLHLCPLPPHTYLSKSNAFAARSDPEFTNNYPQVLSEYFPCLPELFVCLSPFCSS